MSSLKDYVAQLSGPDEVDRVNAAEDIGYLNTPDGVPALLERLGDESSFAVREAIFQALIRIDGEASIQAAVRLLADENPYIRNQAVDVLRHKSGAIPFLTAAMRDGNTHLRKLVLDVLSGIETGGTGDIYTAALSDDDPNVVMTAVENIGKGEGREFRPQIEDLLRAESHPMLIAACLEALAVVGDDASLAAIRRRFPDLAGLPDLLLTSWLKAMAALGSAREFAAVATLLTARGAHLRPAILGALIAIHARCGSRHAGPDLMPALRAVIEGPDPPMTRYQAVRLLGVWADQDDVCAWLVSCLSNSDRCVRLGAAESLRTTDRPDLARVLAARVLEESDDDVRQALTC